MFIHSGLVLLAESDCTLRVKEVKFCLSGTIRVTGTVLDHVE